ncbi:MAG: hypothetical protein QNJ49_06905 [Mastigocoleus sp. MO_167.B18]|nr:hypothetical protein [Mastigocoleus sp. MO_167.B18]
MKIYEQEGGEKTVLSNRKFGKVFVEQVLGSYVISSERLFQICKVIITIAKMLVLPRRASGEEV